MDPRAGTRAPALHTAQVEEGLRFEWLHDVLENDMIRTCEAPIARELSLPARLTYTNIPMGNREREYVGFGKGPVRRAQAGSSIELTRSLRCRLRTLVS